MTEYREPNEKARSTRVARGRGWRKGWAWSSKSRKMRLYEDMSREIEFALARLPLRIRAWTPFILLS